ncbi:hypothetical protein P692DRAFT_20752257, partial [Suillus brevipes Sb2]
KNRSAHHLHLSPVIEVLVWCCPSCCYSALRARMHPLATGVISKYDSDSVSWSICTRFEAKFISSIYRVKADTDLLPGARRGVQKREVFPTGMPLHLLFRTRNFSAFSCIPFAVGTVLRHTGGDLLC